MSSEKEIERLNEIKLGQVVWFEVVAEAAGVTLKAWRPFTVIRMRMDSGSDDVYCVYALSNDPPSPYHYGKVTVENVARNQLKLRDPAALAEGENDGR